MNCNPKPSPKYNPKPSRNPKYNPNANLNASLNPNPNPNPNLNLSDCRTGCQCAITAEGTANDFYKWPYYRVIVLPYSSYYATILESLYYHIRGIILPY